MMDIYHMGVWYFSYMKQKNPHFFGYTLHPAVLAKGTAEISEVAQIVIVLGKLFL